MKIAFITPRYGENILGGAEQLCKKLAEHLLKYYDIEVITTCAEDYVTWKNKFKEGTYEINGVTVIRFKNDFIRTDNFHVLYKKILGMAPDQFEVKFNEMRFNIKKTPEKEQVKWIKLQSPYSSGLLQYLDRKRNIYDFMFFFTYLYPTTYFGIQIAPEKSILIPTAHNEPPIYFHIFNRVFKPSPNESYSIVVLESFLCKTPVLVNGNCAVTKDHCIKSNGGLYFSNYEEFEECINFCLGNPELSNNMAGNGRIYVEDNYNWDKIVDRYKAFFEGD